MKNKIAYRDITSDILRCVAALLVFITHARLKVGDMGSCSTALQFLSFTPAWSGVWIFFLLSGYGVGMGFFSGKYEKESPDFTEQAKAFYIRRFMKIAPLYYLYCILFGLLSDGNYFISDPLDVLRLFTFTFNEVCGVFKIGHLWYISTAFQAYLFMPLFYLLLKKIFTSKKRIIVTTTIILAAGLGIRLGAYALNFNWSSFTYTNIISNIDIILVGMIVAGIRCNCKTALNKIKSRFLKPALWISFALLVLVNMYLYFLCSSLSIMIYKYILPTAYIIICSALLLLSGENTSEKSKFGNCARKAITLFSKHSFAFYVIHESCNGYVIAALRNSTLYYNLTADFQVLLYYALAFALSLLISIPLTLFSDAVYYKFSRRHAVDSNQISNN